MSIEGIDVGLLRKYLLGAMSEAEQLDFELRLVEDDELVELLLSEEDELVDDYLSGDLSKDEQERFDKHFMVTPERQRKLKLGEALSRYTTDPGPDLDPSPNSNLVAIAKPELALRSTAGSTVGRKPIPESWWRGVFSVPYLRLAMTVILLAVGLGGWQTYRFLRGPHLSKGMVALKEAYRNERPTESRISEWDYAPPPPTTRGPERDKFDYQALDRARALIQVEANENPSAKSYHDLGRLYLAETQYDKAIDQFQKALELDPTNAQLHTDLGAAQFELGKADRTNGEVSKSAEEFERALEHLSKAIEIGDSPPEALFNRAILYEYMFLPVQAEQDWRNYLRKDSNSAWANEARDHLRILEEQQKKTSQTKEQILEDFLSAYTAKDDERAWRLVSQTREILSGRMISEQLIDKHLEIAIRAESSSIGLDLSSLAYVGELEAARTGDLYTVTQVRSYRSLTPNQTKMLADARRLMKAGYESYSKPAPREARHFFGKAKQIFQDLNDECGSLFAEYWIGFCFRDAGQTDEGLTIFNRLVQICQEKNFKWLLVRSMLLLSSTQYSLNEYSKAIDWGHGSLNLARQIGDTIGTFNALSVLVEEYRYINNRSQSLRCVQESLAIIDSCPLNPIQIGRHYGIIASAFNSFGLYLAAIEFQREVVRRASNMNHPQMTTIAYATLGLIYAKLGMQNDALANAQIACEVARTNADENIRKLMMANSALQKANIYRQAGDLGKAIDSYNECIGIYDNLDFRYYTYQALKGRLYCYITQGDDALAKEEIQRTLGLAEKYRAKILEANNRNSFFEDQQDLYDLATDFEYSRTGDFDKAYEYSEESRARSLLDLMNASGKVSNKNGVVDIRVASAFKARPMREVKQDIPDKVQIVQYAVLGDRLLIWVISKGDSKTEQSYISQKSLNDKVLRYVELISSPFAASSEDEVNAGKELFTLLIKPVEPHLDRKKQICIVPDKVLNLLPFEALIDPLGEYLITQYRVLRAPSSSVFLRCTETAAAKSGKTPERLLSIGNPSFDHKAFSGFENLDSAAKEAEQITAYYAPGWCSLTGSNASKNRVTGEMKNSDVIHFALHSVADKRSPLRSKLLLAKAPPGSAGDNDLEAVLQAHEIYGLQLKRTRLVILSACETGRDQYSAGEGMLNIARPFLVAGVPLTIASLWPVESESTAELMVLFHKHRKANRGMPSVEALRNAQLDMLASGQERLQRPYAWAAFIAIGGCTEF